MSGVLPTFWTPAGLTAAQSALLVQATAVDGAVDGCAALPDATRAGWKAFYANLKAFCQTQFGWLTTTNPDGSWGWGGGTGETADQLQSYQAQLANWQTTMGSSCNLGLPVVQPTNSGPPPGLVDIVKFGAIGVAFIAVAYTVGKTTGLLSDFEGNRTYRAELRDRRDARRSLRKGRSRSRLSV